MMKPVRMLFRDWQVGRFVDGNGAEQVALDVSSDGIRLRMVFQDPMQLANLIAELQYELGSKWPDFDNPFAEGDLDLQKAKRAWMKAMDEADRE